jgi:hypothetical protein
MNGALARGVGSLYVSTDCMDEDAIAKAVKAAAARRRDHPHPNLVKNSPAPRRNKPGRSNG